MKSLNLSLALLSVVYLAACGGSDLTEEEQITAGGVPIMERLEDGRIVSKHDLNADGTPDIFKYYEEYPDTEDPSVTRMRLTERFVDVNYDGQFNNKREYNEVGKLVKEWMDLDLDGKFDVINHVDNGTVVQKEMLDSETGTVTASRYYANGMIVRVERDISGNSKIDYWEFYEQGVLDRIGRDLNGDGRADSWQTR